MSPLTERQRAVLDIIRRSLAEHGYAPTLREIGAHLKIKSTSGVSNHLMALERKGYLRRDSAKSRALQLLDQPTREQLIARLAQLRSEMASIERSLALSPSPH